MENNEKVKKFNLLYALCYIFLPILLVIAAYYIAIVFIESSAVGTIITAILFIGLVVWYSFLGGMYFKKQVKKHENALIDQGFEISRIFNGGSRTIIVDVNNGRLAIVYFWNPFKYYVFSASGIEKAWVEDGRSGSGIFEGSSRVRFCFIMNGKRVNVNTFTSNKIHSMTSSDILDGISKAEHMVEALSAAKENAASKV